MCLVLLLPACSPTLDPLTQANTASTSQSTVAAESAIAHAAASPVVLFDSFHAHNFLDRGLIPGEHTYHRFTGLRRAASLLSDRQVEVRELMVGPITSERLKDVQLVVLNLPSMDRPPWLTSEIDAVERFIRGGGGMIFITDHTNCYYHQYHLLPLWQRLGLIPTFETACERTKKNLLSPGGPGWLLVRDFDTHPVTAGVRYLGTQTGGRVVGEGVIARTSADAWADAGLSPLYGEGNPGLTGDLQFSASEESGAQGIVLAKTIDQGRVVVISDQNAMGDAQISYADNWRLWLNACDWAGQLKIDTQPLTIDKIAILHSNKPSNRDDSAQTPFDQLVGSEPDRNANPSLPVGIWQIQCWEDLSGGNFYWGGTDNQQYYYFWCWLNRWCWASAHEGPSNPAPSGRVMLLANDRDLQLAGLKQHIQSVLRQNGKVVLLGAPTNVLKSGASPPTDQIKGEFNRSDWLSQQLRQLLSAGEARQLVAAVTWQDQPIVHAQLSIAGGDMVVIPDASLLANSNFTPPETAPSAGQSKWQRQLYHWLFEQP